MTTTMRHPRRLGTTTPAVLAPAHPGPGEALRPVIHAARMLPGDRPARWAPAAR